jgi:hypothetical protein
MEQKLTNEEVARIFAQYLGCEVTDATFVGDSDNEVRNGYLTGLKQENGLVELEVQLHDGLHADEEPTYIVSSEMQLRLNLISSISDEDAIEVAKIILDKDESWNIIRIERSDWSTVIITTVEPDITDPETIVTMYISIYNEPSYQSGPIRWTWDYTKGNSTGVCEQACPNIVPAIDFLRSKGYALPYKGQSLFDLGIAIDATKTDKS